MEQNLLKFWIITKILFLKPLHLSTSSWIYSSTSLHSFWLSGPKQQKNKTKKQKYFHNTSKENQKYIYKWTATNKKLLQYIFFGAKKEWEIVSQ